MEALVFDIDGTLLQSGADNDLYLGAIEAVLGQIKLREGWSAYPHVTNTGILLSILGDNDIPPSSAVVDAVKREFLTRLRDHLDRYGAFPELPGARDYIHALTARNDVVCAYATGCWRASASLKLQRSGFPTSIPLGSSDDATERA
jgi:phosphoglycolate phosphatase-like HAD superfamily hydrolase